MTGRRITVFGGSGFIGRHLVRRLARQGWIVRAAVRDPVRAAFLKPMGNVGQIVPLRVDLAEPRAIAAAIDGADAVVNLVGILHEGGTQRFAALHAAAPGHIAEAVKAQGIGSFVQVSAIGADGGSDALYARSKAEGEARARSAFPEVTVVRPSIVFGPEDSFFNRFATMAQYLPALPLIGGGRTRFQPVYVGDVAEAILRVLTMPEARGRTYELGGPAVYSFRALMVLTLETIGRRRPLIDLPWGAAMFQASILEHLPVPPLTRDQVRMLRRDNVVAPGAAGLAELGIEPTAVEAVIPTYLERFRRGGRFAALRGA